MKSQPISLDREVSGCLNLQIHAFQFEQGSGRSDADAHPHPAIARDDLDDVAGRVVFHDEPLAADQLDVVGIGTLPRSVDGHGG